MEIDRSQLGPLTQLGRPGGQGTVYTPHPTLAESVGVDGKVVVKLYAAMPTPAAGHQLLLRVRWARGLPAGELGRLMQCASWPLAVVKDGGEICGVVMPDMSGRFLVQARAHSGAIKAELLTLGWLLEPEGFLQDRELDIAFDTELRVRWSERLAESLLLLHSYDIVVGDFSMANVLGRPEGKVHAAFIDADSMVFQGRRSMDLVETPGWALRSEWNESPASQQADSYKMGLAMLRLFARKQMAIDINGHHQHVPDQLRPLVRRALGPSMTARPSAEEWLDAIQRIPRVGLNARHPGPVPGQTTTKARIVAPRIGHRQPVVILPPATRPIPPAPAPVAPPQLVAPLTQTFRPPPPPQPAPQPPPPAPAPKPTASPSPAPSVGGARVVWRPSAVWARSKVLLAIAVLAAVGLSVASALLTFSSAGTTGQSVFAAVLRYVLPGLAGGLGAAWGVGLLLDGLVARSRAEASSSLQPFLSVAAGIGAAVAIVLQSKTTSGGSVYVPPSTWPLAAASLGPGLLVAQTISAAWRARDSAIRVTASLGLAAVSAAAAVAIWASTETDPSPSVKQQTRVDRLLRAAIPLEHCSFVSVRSGKSPLVRHSLVGEVRCREGGLDGTFRAFRNNQLMAIYADRRKHNIVTKRTERASLCRRAGGPTNALFAGRWYKESDRSAQLGSFLCYRSQANATLEWADTRSSVYSIVKHPSGARLYRWWKQHSVGFLFKR